VQRFVDEGFISSTYGEYFALDDYSDALAEPGYYRWSTNDAAEPTNFIIQAKVKIDNASTENVFKSGCGFVFLDPFSNHAVFFSLDGNANYRTNGGDRGSNYLDATLFQNPEGVTMTLLLYNKALRFYINDRLALSGITVYGESYSVGPSVLSGTSEGFGTRCDFTEMALWEIK
jgi:hypothetical protein